MQGEKSDKMKKRSQSKNGMKRIRWKTKKKAKGNKKEVTNTTERKYMAWKRRDERKRRMSWWKEEMKEWNEVTNSTEKRDEMKKRQQRERDDERGMWWRKELGLNKKEWGDRWHEKEEMQEKEGWVEETTERKRWRKRDEMKRKNGQQKKGRDERREWCFAEGVCSEDTSFAVYVEHAVINVMIRIRGRKNDQRETELTAALPNTQHQRLTAINEACKPTPYKGSVRFRLNVTVKSTWARVQNFLNDFRNKSSPMWASPKHVVIFKVSIITIWTTICNYAMSFTSKARSDLWDGVGEGESPAHNLIPYHFGHMENVQQT